MEKSRCIRLSSFLHFGAHFLHCKPTEVLRFLVRDVSVVLVVNLGKPISAETLNDLGRLAAMRLQGILELSNLVHCGEPLAFSDLSADGFG